MSLASTLALAPLSAIYGALVSTRHALYRRGALAVHRIDAPVISVGNITTGGTGKTPVVEWLARTLAHEGRRVCILSRGYRRADEKKRVLVSDGERLLADARVGGDEPRLLAESLLGEASVISDADRYGAARWAQEHLGAEIFLLDDGFQHLRLARDLDIVTLDATNPWGGGHLLPRGRLREPLESLRRAACIIITRADLAEDVDRIAGEAARLSDARAVVLKARARTRRLRPLLSQPGETGFDEELAGQPVAAMCAIGNPHAFFAHLRRDGHELCLTRAFPDHHPFTEGEVKAVATEAAACGARALLVTAKDAVKLRPHVVSLPLYVVEIGLEFDDEGRLLEVVRGALTRHA